MEAEGGGWGVEGGGQGECSRVPLNLLQKRLRFAAVLQTCGERHEPFLMRLFLALR